jgi:pimeloyl-ACP methyl ester carboxylesterase
MLNRKKITILKMIPVLCLFNLTVVFPAAGQEDLHVSAVDSIRFSFEQFSIVGNLYLPQSEGKHPVAVWVHGDGPDRRTNRFPGTAFFNTLLDHGFAFFRYDKPGTGDSQGSFTDSLLFQERAGIVNAAVGILKNRTEIDPARIGMAGSSQAGYVMPLVLTMRSDIAFMIGLSLPAMDGNEQWAYLLKKQLICEGYSEKVAEQFSRMHLKMIRAASYEEFMEAVHYFENNPVKITSIKGYDEHFAERVRNWWPLAWTKAQSFNPMEIIARTTIPVLAVYGENDTQVDPRQGAEAYRNGLEKAENPLYEVVILPEANHNMAYSKTGCLKEQQEQKKSKMVDGLTGILAAWLDKLNQYTGNPE